MSVNATPEFATAAKKTLELRGDGGAGWSTVWRAALWARLQDPENVYANLRILMTNSTLPDMLDLCPPFKVNSNLGRPGPITERLVQTSPGTITALPGLPRRLWPEGDLRRVRLRGGATAVIAWKYERLTKFRLQSDPVQTYRSLTAEDRVDIPVTPSRTVVIDGALHTAVEERIQ